MQSAGLKRIYHLLIYPTLGHNNEGLNEDHNDHHDISLVKVIALALLY